MPATESSAQRRRRLSAAPSAPDADADDEESGDNSSGFKHLAQGMPMGRSYVAHAAPTPTTWKASSSWSHDSEDIREGSARLGNLSLVAAMSSLKSPGSPGRGLPPSPLQAGKRAHQASAETLPSPQSPSGLSKMFKRNSQLISPSIVAPVDAVSRPSIADLVEPSSSSEPSSGAETIVGPTAAEPSLKKLVAFEPPASIDEQTPLLATGKRKQRSWVGRFSSWLGLGDVKASKEDMSWNETKEMAYKPIQYLPATLLGVLMNILDGVSYGLVTFPTLPVFAGFGGIGVSMFFVSCITSQLVTTRRSVFRGGNGSMMIEIVPFLHAMIFTINNEIGDDLPHRVIATSMVAIALSSVLTGLTFFLLGSLRLGVLLQFFPRHILVGTIGGVGAFLIITGLQVTARLEEDDDLGDGVWQTIQTFFQDDMLPLWTIPLGLAIFLRLVTAKFHHPLILPAFFLLVPVVFYTAVAALHLPIDQLRQTGWIFDLGPDTDAPWWKFWTLFDFGDTDIPALMLTVPTQLALVFFAILHVPINVPALALSVGNDDVRTDPELVNHGISNLVAGLIGTVPNYLCYVNSVLFYRLGGDSRLASFMLAVATSLVMITGTTLIRVLPVMVVGALIYILGIDLMKEAVYDTWGRVNHFEYATIWLIILVMTFSDFVIGIGVGILVACVSFVVSSAKINAVRFVQSGASARSTVRRHPQQGKFLRHVGSQIRILGLDGQIFFGTTVGVEATIRALFETDMRYLVLDFTRVYGIDFSAAEAFLRLHRLCQARSVILVLCGCSPRSAVGKALRAVDLWPGGVSEDAEFGIEVFATLNDALEHCENAQLRALYASDLRPSKDASPLDGSAIAIGPHAGIGVDIASSSLNLAHSPRRNDLLAAAKRNLSSVDVQKAALTDLEEPVALLIQALLPYGEDLVDDPEAFFTAVKDAFDEVHFEEGKVVWHVNDRPDSLFIIQSGILKVSYEISRSNVRMVESMMPATVAGEMTFIADQPRYAEMIAERACVLWRLTQYAFEALEISSPANARILRKIFIRNARDQQDAIVGHIVFST